MSLHAAASAERHDTPVAGTPAGTEAPAHRPSVAPAPKTRGRVLVVDDEPSTRRAIRMGVEASGYEVETAYDGTTALKLFTSGRPYDVVVSDVSMPNMDGVDLLASLAVWPQGQFLHFNGLTRLVSAAWPFTALAYLIWLAADRERRV